MQFCSLQSWVRIFGPTKEKKSIFWRKKNFSAWPPLLIFLSCQNRQLKTEWKIVFLFAALFSKRFLKKFSLMFRRPTAIFVSCIFVCWLDRVLINVKRWNKFLNDHLSLLGRKFWVAPPIYLPLQLKKHFSFFLTLLTTPLSPFDRVIIMFVFCMLARV